MKDQQIIDSIRHGKHTTALRYLYTYLPVVRKYIVKNSGSREDALDIYQDALVIFCTRVSNPEFVLTSSVQTYLFSISKNKWMEELRRRGKNEKITWNASEEIQTADWQVYEEKMISLQGILAEIGNKCQRIFSMFYFEKLDMRSIAAKLGYTSEQNAATQKYKCMERARKLAQDKNLLKDAL